MQTPISTRPCLLLIPFLFLNLQCQKEKTVSKPPEEVPSVHPIVGQWEWQYGIDYYQDTFTPVSTGEQRKLHFMANDSVHLYFVKPTHITDAVVPYWFETIIDGSLPDSTVLLMIDAFPYFYEISKDTLITDSRLGDMGVWRLYTRQNSP